MGQIKVIHEHYDSKPLRSLIVGLLIAILAGVNLITDKDRSLADLVLSALIVFPPFVIMVFELLRWNKPAIVVYNDRLEVKAPSKYTQKIDELLYSDIRNIAMESGQLLIWLDESSAPVYFNLGANAANAQETYNILRSAYDKYNQEHNITPAQIENLPRRNKKLIMAITIFIMIAIMILLFELR